MEHVEPGSHCTSTISVVWLVLVVPRGFKGGVGTGAAGGGGGGARDYCCYNFFFLNNPTNSSICLQRKCRRSDVGRCCRPNARPAPAAVQGRDVSCIYIYIYIYLYIYAFPFPVSCQGQYVAAGTSVLSWRIQNEGPFFTVLWLGLDQKRQHLFTEVRIPVASCPSPLGMGLFLCIRQLWLPACQDAAVWPP